MNDTVNDNARDLSICMPSQVSVVLRRDPGGKHGVEYLSTLYPGTTHVVLHWSPNRHRAFLFQDPVDAEYMMAQFKDAHRYACPDCCPQGPCRFDWRYEVMTQNWKQPKPMDNDLTSKLCVKLFRKLVGCHAEPVNVETSSTRTNCR